MFNSTLTFELKAFEKFDAHGFSCRIVRRVPK